MPAETIERRIGLIVFALASAGSVFWLGYDGGGYSVTSYTSSAMAVLWALLVGAALGLLPAARVPRPAFAIAALLGGLAVLTAASAGWAASAEDAYAELARVLLYLAVFALVASGVARTAAARFADGLALGIGAVAVLALASRFFSGLVSLASLRTLLPTAFARLSYPLNYWNGLAIFVALAFPLLLRAAAAERSAVARGAAVAPLPALAAVIFLASSRGGAATAVIGTIVFVSLAGTWSAFVPAVVGGAASAAAIAVLHEWPDVINPSLERGVTAHSGHMAALAVAAVGVGAGALFALGCALVSVERPPTRQAAYVLTGVALVAAGAVIAFSHPVRRFEDFKRPPPPPKGADFVQSHLLSSNGSGRWQFWRSALDEFRDRPSVGRGAGSFEEWWAQHGSLAVFVRDAHSLYLEELGELGIVGLALVAGAFLAGIGSAIARLRRVAGAERVTVAAFLACFVAYALAAAIDWIWELAAVSAVGIACLGALAGTATAAPDGDARPRPRRLGVALRICAVVAAAGLLVAEAIPLLSAIRIGDSQAAVRRGDAAAARRDALRARDIEPWAATPYLQLALVDEQAGSLAGARGWILQAIHHDERDWRLWYVRARIETRLGAIEAAVRSLARARALNPRSPLLRR